MAKDNQKKPANQPHQQNAKSKQLDQYRKDHKNSTLTTNQGMPVSNTADSLKAGERGPTLMEDFHFREKMMHFDNERIPERVVHARGFGVHGYFQVYEPQTELTSAKFLQDPSVKTPVFTRFSTVVGQKGSDDTVRDVRGFATKFYTEDGNYDLVSNNMPVFFFHDAMKFPDFVHSIKPEPHNEMPQATAAHDTLWDFVVSNPESAHMMMWLMSDRAIPRSFRMMEGFGVNTFRFVNAEGKGRFVKFHWKPLLGAHSLVWDESEKLRGADPDFLRRDLWDAINNGDYPEFELGVQILEEEDEFAFDFDILDPTKLWPEEQVPVKKIGKMTLNQNQDNFFAETEQVAFHPGHVVPGIDFSNDPMLQGRLFSYLDTQLLRLGGPNFAEIPINRPIVPVKNNQREGFHRMSIDKGAVSYSANSMRGNSPEPDPENGFKHHAEKVEGRKTRKRSDSFNDHYSQATLFWNSMSFPEQQHIIKAFHFEVGKVKDKTIRQRVVDMFNNVDGQLASQIAMGIGVNPPENPGGSGETTSSPALSQENTIKSATTRKVAILIENGFDLKDVDQVTTELGSAGLQYDIISKHQGMITSADGKQIEANKSYAISNSVMYDAIYIPGGKQSTDQLMSHNDAKTFVNDAFVHAKTIGAANSAVDLLMISEIKQITLADKNTPNTVATDMGIVSIRDSRDLSAFSHEFITNIAQHRHWARENKDGKMSG
ncbi:catalase [Lentibacillus sp. CBA3610]|uniref:catalase n=1 Tax=Lentibacillus sp. CBA3610 TaxID=2518176 RepID=UPI0015950718|nr:catalase [Lentibacillus sp. CBA3610]QKY68801.1 catalase [Lentibacillus sp. CBA3610]